ncbi:hypothetical protein ScPMuIL_008930 [Solemya velum]
MFAQDPCSPSVYAKLPYAYQRSVHCPSQLNNFCDNYLSDNWYRVEVDNHMPTECVPINRCGTTFPIWMDGSLPSVADGAVERTACMSYFSNCCYVKTAIQVKNCSSFSVYYLPQTSSCPLMYCFGSSKNCDPPTTTVTTTAITTTTTSTTSRPECGDWTFGLDCGDCVCVKENTAQCSKTDGSCTCKDGWEGDKCQTDVNECLLDPCGAYSQCDNQNGSYSCRCLSGYHEQQGSCTECDEWTFGFNCTGVCVCVKENTAQCSKTDGSCACKNGWEGDKCQTDVNECLLDPCGAYSQCHNQNGSYSCQCVPGYHKQQESCMECDDWSYGKNCASTCDCVKENTERCSKIDGTLTCKQGWIGDRCESECDDWSYGKNCASTCDCVKENTERCSNIDGTFTCKQGWIGDRCEKDVDECAIDPVPCVSNSLCENEAGSYSCPCVRGYQKVQETCQVCPAGSFGNGCAEKCQCNSANTHQCRATDGTCICNEGWTGRTCDIDIDECESSPCVEYQACVNEPGSFKCECLPGYKDIDNQCIECDNWKFGSQCKEQCKCSVSNTLSCSKKDGTCVCKNGWIGHTCGENKNKCLSMVCMKNGECVNNNEDYGCQCKDGYREVDGECTECDHWKYGKECRFKCECNGTHTEECSKIDGSCTCKNGWQGEKCSTDVNECLRVTCPENAKCINLPGAYMCSCIIGFEDRDGICKECVDGMYGDRCASRCTCNVTNTDRCSKVDGTCTCKSGWAGPNCNFDIDECISSTFKCPDQSVCENEAGSYHCECIPGYKNSYGSCEECVAWTYGKTCAECRCSKATTQQCSKETGACQCKEGWMGEHCDADISKCQLLGCDTYEECVNNNSEYRCQCLVGYENKDGKCKECEQGKFGRGCNNTCFCEKEHTALCMKEDGRCICKDGWAGEHCLVDVDECLDSPCGIDRECVNKAGTYKCVCKKGFSDRNGVCTEYGLCPEGWTGITCHDDINECDDNPCSHSGKCVNTEGSYFCECLPGFEDEDDCKDASVNLPNTESLCSISLEMIISVISCLLLINVISVITTCLLTRRKYADSDYTDANFFDGKQTEEHPYKTMNDQCDTLNRNSASSNPELDPMDDPNYNTIDGTERRDYQRLGSVILATDDDKPYDQLNGPEFRTKRNVTADNPYATISRIIDLANNY